MSEDPYDEIERMLASLFGQQVAADTVGALRTSEIDPGELFSMANCGLPGTAGFVGEWMVILGAVQFNFWIGLGAATALILGASYTLWMYKRVYLGATGNDHVRQLKDINARECLMLALLAAAILGMGLYPKPFTDVMDASVTHFLQHVATSKLN